MYTNNYSYKYFCCRLAHRNVQCFLRALVTLQTPLQLVKSRSVSYKTCCLVSSPGNICLMRTWSLSGNERSCSWAHLVVWELPREHPATPHPGWNESASALTLTLPLFQVYVLLDINNLNTTKTLSNRNINNQNNKCICCISWQHP